MLDPVYHNYVKLESHLKKKSIEKTACVGGTGGWGAQGSSCHWVEAG
jgi:hypothetical protein